MQHTIALKMLAGVSDEGFSLDELILELSTMLETKGMAEIASLVLRLVEEVLMLEVMKDRRRFPSYGERCCDTPQLHVNDRRQRQRGIRSRIGEIPLRPVRYRCRSCGKSFTPLRSYLGLDAQQPKSNELEHLIIEVIKDQSYRRTQSHLQEVGTIGVPLTTLHRWVRQSDCDWIPVSDETPEVEHLFVDGTGYKRRPREDVDNKGEVRLMFGVTVEGETVPFGAWSGESWDEIGNCISSEEEDDPVAEILISDGEEGLIAGVGHLARDHQRCDWHLVRDLGHAMWEDGAPLEERKETSSELAALLAVEVPEEAYEEVSDDDLEDLEQHLEELDEDIRLFVERLHKMGYNKAAWYVMNARSRLFTHLRYWLKYGLVCPRTISKMERLMREIARRLKRIAFGWSQEGAAQMARIILKRVTNPQEWENYWRDRMGLKGRVKFIYKGVSVIEPQSRCA